MRTQRNVTVVPYTTLYRSAGDREREVLRRRHDGRAGGAARRRAIPRHHLERLRPLRLRAQGWFDVRWVPPAAEGDAHRSEEHTSELQSNLNLVCRLLLEK